MNIVIMAGGGGTRLWPLSIKSNPKQFLDLGTGKTLLEHTYDRARKLAEPGNIYVATTKEHTQKIHDILKNVSADNIFTEPERRETAPAFAATAIQLTQRGQEDVPTLYLWADHVFTDEDSLIRDLGVMKRLVEEDSKRVVIFGHIPITPETGYGYMKMGAQVEGYTNVHVVDSFKEKPDLETAERYVLDGSYFWNIGYMCVTPKFLLEELRVHAPAMMAGFEPYAEAMAQGNEEDAFSAYRALPSLAIDYALNERTKNIVAVTGDYGWSDVGSWAVVKELFGAEGDHVPHGHHVHVDSHNNYIYNATHKAVSLIGVHDTVVVVTDSAVLITDVASSQKVKEVVKKLDEDEKHQYL